MAEVFTSATTATAGGDTFTQNLSVTSDTFLRATPSVPAAKGGTLSTRTNNTDGTLTLGSGHGILTADVIDLFWSGGSRRGVTVGTVSGTSVPISGGSGDNLPAAATVIACMVPVSVPLPAVGDNVDALAVYSDATLGGYVSFWTSAPALIVAYKIPGGTDAGRSWITGNGVTNPLASATVATARFSHSDTSQARTMKAVLVV